MDWLLCLLSQHADGVWHPLDAWRPLRTKKSKAVCCCSKGPVLPLTEADTAWQPLLQGGRSGARIRHCSFSGGLPEGLVSDAPVSPVSSTDENWRAPDARGPLRTKNPVWLAAP